MMCLIACFGLRKLTCSGVLELLHRPRHKLEVRGGVLTRSHAAAVSPLSPLGHGKHCTCTSRRYLTSKVEVPGLD